MDFPSGPLDIYRKKASFNWKEMLNFLEGEDIQAFKVPKFSRLIITFPISTSIQVALIYQSCVRLDTMRY